MTGFGIYLAIVSVLGILSSIYYLGKGGVEYGPGVLLLSVIWSLANLLGIILIGTGHGI